MHAISEHVRVLFDVTFFSISQKAENVVLFYIDIPKI